MEHGGPASRQSDCGGSFGGGGRFYKMHETLSGKGQGVGGVDVNAFEDGEVGEKDDVSRGGR